ncbi:MAG: hypothetical protein ACYCSA_00105 [Thermoplasmataceae archaeon]
MTIFSGRSKSRKRSYELQKGKESLRGDLEKMTKDSDEYMVRHPENVGIKNGKPNCYTPETATTDRNNAESEPKLGKKRPEEMLKINIKTDVFHGELNYTISQRK